MNLNPEQLQAVEHFDGPCIVVATPGSGKTRVLTQRVVKLIQKGVKPENLLCLTFTNKAANEMRERVSKEIGQNSSKVWIGTFHSFFLVILRKYGNLINISSDFSIYDDKDQKELIEKIARMRDVELSSFKIASLCKIANDSRENLNSLSDYADLQYQEKEIIEEYFDALSSFNALDFSGILHKTHELLSQHESVRKILSARFRYVLGDEWQDTNTIQYESIKYIAAHGNLFVVGDPNQSIFGFRSAKPENLTKIHADFENVKEVVLPRNYRSTSNILTCAQRLIRNNTNAKNVSLISTKGAGQDVSIKRFLNPDHESDYICSEIKKIKTNTGCPWNSFAILYRVNSLSKIPEMTLRRHGIPYRVYGGFSFFDRSEIKTSLSYLSLLANEHDTIAFSRAIQCPKRHIGPAVIGKLERLCQNEKISIINACKKADLIPGITQDARKNLNDFIKIVEKYKDMTQEKIGRVSSEFLKEIGYYEYMVKESEKNTDNSKRVDNINELLISISDYESQKKNASLSDYLQSVELFSSDTNDEEDSVSLLTMHSCKGLEFPYVYIIGAEQGMIPHKKSASEGIESIEEERRLMFVAATRGQVSLSISYCEMRKSFNFSQKSNRVLKSSPSQFLYELNPGHPSLPIHNNDRHSALSDIVAEAQELGFYDQ